MGLELSPDERRPGDAHADKPDTAAREAFNCRDSDTFTLATGKDIGLGQRQADGAAHDRSARLAAASASRAWV